MSNLPLGFQQLRIYIDRSVPNTLQTQIALLLMLLLMPWENKAFNIQVSNFLPVRGETKRVEAFYRLVVENVGSRT